MQKFECLHIKKKNQYLWSGMHKLNKVKLTNWIFPHISNGELKIIKMVEQWCLQEINSCLVNFKSQAKKILNVM